MNLVKLLTLALTLSMITGAVQAGDRGTKDEALALVKKTVTLIKEKGDAAFAMINAGEGFKDKDLYVTAVRNGTSVADSFNAKMVGKDLSELTDVDGKAFMKERAELGKKNAPFSQTYKFTDPVTKKILQKEAFCEAVGDVVICSAIYKE